jgi:hypothetical protein
MATRQVRLPTTTPQHLRRPGGVAKRPVAPPGESLHEQSLHRSPRPATPAPVVVALFRSPVQRRTAMRKLRIVACGVSGGRSLTGPFRDARRLPSARPWRVPGATRTTLTGFVHRSRSILPSARPWRVPGATRTTLTGFVHRSRSILPSARPWRVPGATCTTLTGFVHRSRSILCRPVPNLVLRHDSQLVPRGILAQCSAGRSLTAAAALYPDGA